MNETFSYGCAEHISEPHKDCPYCKVVNNVRTNDPPSFRFTPPPFASIHFATLEDAVRALYKAQGVELIMGDKNQPPTPITDRVKRGINGYADEWVPRYVAEELERKFVKAREQRDECERQYQEKVSEMLLVVSQRDDATRLLSTMCFHHLRLLGLDGAFDEVLTNAAAFLESLKGGSNE